MAGSIENQVKIQIQPSYPLNSSISAQSTVRFGSTYKVPLIRGETNSLCQSVRQYIKHQVKFLVQEYYRVRQSVLEFMQARQDHSYYDSDRVGHSTDIHHGW